jgi:hypothetical protein
MLDSMLVNFWLNYSKANKFSTSWEEKMISHGASDGELCKQQVKAAKCTPITLYTFQMENILCGSGWMTGCSLSRSEGFGHTPFLFHKCSSDVVIFSWSQSQNLFGLLRTYAFAMQVSLIIVSIPLEGRPACLQNCVGCKSMYAFSTPTNTEMEAADFGFRN